MRYHVICSFATSLLCVTAAPLLSELRRYETPSTSRTERQPLLDLKYGLGIGPQVASTLDKRSTAGEFKRDAEAFQIPPGREMDWVVPEGCNSKGSICFKAKREAEPEPEAKPEAKPEPEPEAKPEALVLLPGMRPINLDGCNNPLICASLK